MRFPAALCACLTMACSDGAPGRLPLVARSEAARPPHASFRVVAEPDEELEPGELGELLGDFQLTFYWIALENDFAGGPTVSLYDRSCNVLATVSNGFADSLRMEGTGRLADGRVLNYAGRCPCRRSPCFVEVDPESHPWGIGVEDRPLVPFRSVAVDPMLFPPGKRLHIQELAGMRMPGNPPWGGFVHDGCVVADDRGGNIDGRQLDFFSAWREHYRELDPALRLGRVTVRLGGDYCR